uniref:Uncharacterized protein n=1 Tax=Micrurus corallinus TaxID=54390 RepID=A0A2D4FUU4_MICCO
MAVKALPRGSPEFSLPNFLNQIYGENNYQGLCILELSSLFSSSCYRQNFPSTLQIYIWYIWYFAMGSVLCNQNVTVCYQISLFRSGCCANTDLTIAVPLKVQSQH